MSNARSSGGGGCCALVALAFVIALVVAAVASAAAIVDPFAWLPSVSELWSHCEDKFATARDECAWANRFPGFWPHMLANLAWAVSAVACAVVVVMAALHVREARRERFDGYQALERYRTVRTGFLRWAVSLSVLAAVPVLVVASRGG